LSAPRRKLQALVDTNVFIFSLELPESNSSLAVDSLAEGLFIGFVSDVVVEELAGYMRRAHGRQDARLYVRFLEESCDVIGASEYSAFLAGVPTDVSRKDRPHVAAARSRSIPHVVSADSDLEVLGEHISPPDFVELLGKKRRKGDV